MLVNTVETVEISCKFLPCVSFTILHGPSFLVLMVFVSVKHLGIVRKEKQTGFALNAELATPSVLQCLTKTRLINLFIERTLTSQDA